MMKKLDNFVVVSVADSISKMSNEQIRLLATLLADGQKASSLSDQLIFAIQDKEYSNIEVQETVY